jgi:hypothetical protein
MPVRARLSELVNRQFVLTHDSADPIPPAESESSHAGTGDDAGAHREAESLGFPVEVCERTPACTRAGVLAAPRACLAVRPS